MRRLLNAIRNLLRHRSVDRELTDEVHAYQELLADEKRRAGLAPADALRAARLEAGGSDAVVEAVRDARPGAWIEQLWRDSRYAIRTLRRSPGFTAFTTLTFAVAIGGLSVIFSLVNAVLLQPLPYPASDRLVVVLEARAEKLTGGFAVAAPNYLDWQRQNDVFERMALYEYGGYNLSDGVEPEQVGGLRVTGGVFELLGVAPMLGRGLVPSDDAGGHVVVLSHRVWQRRYGADSALVGRTIRINRESWQVVGIMPPGFAFPSSNQDVWVPINLNAEDQGRGSHSFWSIARLKDGVSLERARTAMRTIGDRLAKEYPVSNAGESVNAFPMRDLWVTDVQETLRTLLIAVALVLLIASANIASLIVARDAARRREIAARMALGGSRWRIVGQLVTESVVLAIAGAGLGLVLAVFGIRSLVALLPPALRFVPFRDLTAATLDPLVVAVAVAVAIVAGIVAGLVPALAALPQEPADAMRDGGARSGMARRSRRLKGSLVALEVALAVVVLVGAGLLISSISRLQRVEPGFEVRNLMALGMELPQADFYGPAERPTFCADVTREVGAVPGVTGVSAVSHLPLSGANAGRSFVPEGAIDTGPANLPSASYGVVCPEYFRTAGIPLVSGRSFTDADRNGTPLVVVINERLREVHFPGQDPVGRRFKLGNYESPETWLTIVGVVGDVRHGGLTTPAEPYFWAPYAQAAWPRMWVMVRTTTNPLAAAGPVRAALRRAVPGEPIDDPETMERVLDNSLGNVRFPMVLFAVFAAAALALAGLGCFGVASQSVVQQRRELAIRMALGARAGQVYGMVIMQAMKPVAWGLLAGILGALAGTRILGQLLYGIKPTDPVTLLLGAGVLAATTVAACVLPARRAARVDPAGVLREE